MKVQVKGSVLKAARDDRGISPENAASKLGIKSSSLLTWESHDGDLSITTLKKAARIYGGNWLRFLLERPLPPLKKKRKHRRTAQGMQISDKEYTSLYKVNYILSSTDFTDTAYLSPLAGLRRGETNVNEVSKKIKQLFKLEIQTQERLASNKDGKRQLYEYLKNVLIEKGFYIFEHDLKGTGIRAYSIKIRGVDAIVINRSDVPAGKSFSLIHELVHLIDGEEVKCDIREQGKSSYDQSEARSNRTASLVLIPSRVFDNFEIGVLSEEEEILDTANGIARNLAVSSLAVLTRMLYENFVTQEMYENLSKKLIKKFYEYKPPKNVRKSWPRTYIRDNSVHFSKNVVGAYEKGGISFSDVGKILDIPHHQIERVVNVITADYGG